jgi:hypothetical protein
VRGIIRNRSVRSKQPKPWIYRDQRYRFSVSLPAWWKAYTVVSQRKLDKDSSYEVHFRFKYKGKLYDDIFAVFVYPFSRESWVKQGYEESPFVYIGEHGGKSFAYLTPEELPYAFVDRKTGDYDMKKYGKPIRLLKKMVNDEVPRVISTFAFPRTGKVARGVRAAAPPWLAKKARVRHCGCRRRGR